MVLAPIEAGKLGALRGLLQSMNSGPGQVDPDNPIVPFGRLATLHFARILILDDQTTGDCAVYNLPVPVYPLWLAFLGDYDGDYDDFLGELVRQAGAGLRQLFSHCAGFDSKTDLQRWMRGREHRPSTYYANWRGRTVRQCLEEEKLRHDGNVMVQCQHIRRNRDDFGQNNMGAWKRRSNSPEEIDDRLRIAIREFVGDKPDGHHAGRSGL